MVFTFFYQVHQPPIQRKAKIFMAETLHLTLATLPAEILGQIIAHIDTARALSHLAFTCSRIHTFVEKNGFRIFAQTRFRYVQCPVNHSATFWKDASHGMTTLTRNWERRAFIARKISSSLDDIRNDGRRRPPQNRNRGQTMGFIPVIDSYEEWYGGDWASRTEVVAWGGGAEVVIRIKTMGDRSRYDLECGAEKSSRTFDVHQHEYEWIKYREEGALEGRDDITSVNLLLKANPGPRTRIIIGRANGGLRSIGFSKAASSVQELTTYETKGRPLRSATVSGDKNSLLAACLSDSSIALYDISSEAALVFPLAETSVISSGKSIRTWTSHFLSKRRLAVGCGSCKDPLLIYDVGNGELTKHATNIRDCTETMAGDLCGTSVYSVASIPASAFAGGAEGDVFLSGSHDGLVR